MKTQQTLNIIFYTSIVLSLLAVVLFETNTLIGGWWADNRSADFLCTTFLDSVWFVQVVLTRLE